MTQVALIVLIMFMLPGCMVGPQYLRPTTLVPRAYQYNAGLKESVHPMTTGWEIFNDPCLKKLLERALAQNLDLKIALERVEQFRAQYLLQRAQLLPQIDALVEANKSRNRLGIVEADTVDQQGRITTFSLYRVELATTWEIDLWGRIRHARNAAYHQYEAYQEDVGALAILLSSNVASTYLELTALEQSILLREQRIMIDTALKDLASDRQASGVSDERELQAREAELEESKNLLIILKTLSATTMNNLALLLGELPEEFSLLSLCKTLPRGVPQPSLEPGVGLPSELVRRRPDIRKAERLFAAATEKVGEACADYFPRFSLVGALGALSPCFSSLLTSSGFQWLIGQSTSWPVVTFGRLGFNLDAVRSVERQHLLDYAQTVLKAFQDVEDTLVSYFNQKKQVTFKEKKLQAFRRERDLIESRFYAGLLDKRSYLEAEKSVVIAQEDLVSAQRDMSVYAVQLYKALGGGWTEQERAAVEGSCTK